MDYPCFSPTRIGKSLRELRGEKTLADVSKAIRISASALAMYENGYRIPRDEIKIRIANYYGRSVESIFYRGIPLSGQYQIPRRRKGVKNDTEGTESRHEVPDLH